MLHSILEHPKQLTIMRNSCIFLFGSNEWGTVCSNSWSYGEANVVCKQLGYTSAVGYGSGVSFEPGYRRVWMVDVNCTGQESQLNKCSFHFVGWDVMKCSHTTQAAVACACK